MHGRDPVGVSTSETRIDDKRAPARSGSAYATATAARTATVAAGDVAAARLDAWQSAVPLLRTRFGDRNFARWLDSVAVRDDGHRLALATADRARARALKQHFLPGITDALRAVGYTGEVTVAEPAGGDGIAPSAGTAAPPEHRVDRGGEEDDRPLDARYTFARFVVGESNRFAHAAARIVAESPGTIHNPLYLHGGVGLGKTHLAIAIAHAVAAARGRCSAAAISAERFRALCEARDETASELALLRDGSDVVVFDDVQLLTRDEAILDELFRWVDALIACDRQVVLTCDLPPRAIPSLAARLASRCENGFYAEMRRPDVALRREIVRRRAAMAGVTVAEAVVEFIADCEENSVRALEGAFNRARELAASTSQDLSLALARRALGARAHGGAPSVPDLDAVLDAVAATFGLSARALRARKRRDRDAALARQAAVYVARRVSGLPLRDIAADFGFRDHSVAAHACAALRARLERDGQLASRVREVEQRLGATTGP
ncbi:MAG TPA: DnaA/Hda family protein [Candidatus Binatia bacterium]|nr:DnaA/Hda family protein [Candidatus Binatia bacterium]